MNKSASKKALIASAAALSLSALLFAGTTYAWFTDSASSSTSVIKSGNLDMSLKVWSPAAKDYVEVTDKTNLLETASPDSSKLWEPGHTEVVYLKVSNLGSLALNYQLTVSPTAETEGTNVYKSSFKLSDYLVFSQIEDAKVTLNEDKEAILPYTREQARAAAGEKLGLESYTKEQILYPEGTEDQDSEKYIALVIYMPESVDNKANYLTGTDAPTIELGAKLTASQAPVEKDSFDEKYDSIALENTLFPPKGDGTYVTEDGQTYVKFAGTYTAVTPTDIAGLYTDESGNQYATTTEALKTAESGGDYSLAQDLNPSLTSTWPLILLQDGTKSSIDFGGNSIVIDSTSGYNCLKATNGSTLSLSNGTLETNYTVSQTLAPVSAYGGSTVYVDNMTVIQSSTHKNATAVYSDSGGSKVIITNSIIIHETVGDYDHAIHCDTNGSVELYNSTVIGRMNVTNKGAIYIYSGDYTQAVQGGSGNSYHVYGGTFSSYPLGIAEGYEPVYNEENGTWTVQPIAESD